MVDDVTIAIAAAVAGKAAEQLTDSGRAALKKLRQAVRARFRQDPDARDALESAQDDYEDAVVVEELAEHLDSAQRDDTEIRRLAEELRPYFADAGGGVTNTVNGDVRDGTVIQARDITGGVNLDR